MLIFSLKYGAPAVKSGQELIRFMTITALQGGMNMHLYTCFHVHKKHITCTTKHLPLVVNSSRQSNFHSLKISIHFAPKP